MHPAASRLLTVILGTAVLAACGSGAGSAPANESAADTLNRALQLHLQGKLDEATSAYYLTLSKDPGNKYAFYNLGVIASTRGGLAIAEDFYRIAIEIDPKFSNPLFNLAILRQNAGAFPEAIELYKRVIAIEPNNANAHFNLALAYRSNGQKAEADAEFARAQQLDAKLVPPPPATSATPRPSGSPAR
jgi:tetratricopeptide (TPR) repeat protein